MEIYLRTSFGDKRETPLRVNSDDTIRQIKDKCASLIGIPVPRQRFIFQGEYVNDNAVVSSFVNLKHAPMNEWYSDKLIFVVTNAGPFLRVVPYAGPFLKLDEHIQILVRFHTISCIDVHPKETIEEIQYKIYSKIYLAPHEYMFLSGRGLLFGDRTPEDYRMSNGTNICVRPRIRGD